MAIGTFLYPSITSKLGDSSNKIDQLEQEYASLLEQLKKSNQIVEFTLKDGEQTTAQIANNNLTIYNTVIKMNQPLLAGKDITKFVGGYVYHPNGSVQVTRMFIASITVQQYGTDPKQSGILVSCTPVGSYQENYYNSLKVRLFFNNSNYGV